MVWILALMAGLVGAALESERVLGFWLGAAVAVLLIKLRELRHRLEAAEQELVNLRLGQGLKPIAGPAEVPSKVAVAEPDAEEVNRGDSGAVAASTEQQIPSEEALAQPPAAKSVASQVPASDLPPVPDLPDTQRDSEAQPRAPKVEPATLSPAPSPLPKLSPLPPDEPSAVEQGLMAVKRWFTEGNVPVKVGVLVLFAGVAAALRFAAQEGYFNFPIGLRLSLIAAVGLLGLGLGWRERERRPVFGLSLQGGAIGILLLTVFAAFRLYGLLPSGLAFVLVVGLVAGASMLAVLQRAMALAVLGFLGGYLAPVLLSTGSGNHVALFSYYAVLNVAVLAISWRQHWRLLNLIGFVFTFGVGSAWFSRSYQPELFWTVEPFLILFFLFYVLIGLLYVIRQSESRRPWVDGTLVFGTPLVAFPMQAVLLRDQRMALAFSAVAVAAVYLALLLWLRRRHHERLLTEAYASLAVGFATLAVPLAFSAGTTASLWALQGAAVAWFGLRQGRTLPWLSGLGLQLLASVAYLISEIDRGAAQDWLLLNGTWLGAAMLGFAGVAMAWIHDRLKPVPLLPAVLMIWGLGWWTAAGFSQIGEAERLLGDSPAGWYFAMAYFALSLLLAGAVRHRLGWARAGWGMALWATFGLFFVPWADEQMSEVLAPAALPAWIGYLLAWLCALWLNRHQSVENKSDKFLALTHGVGLWAVVFALATHLNDVLQTVASGWSFLAIITPLAVMSLGLWRRPEWPAWPRAEPFREVYGWLWFGPALLLLILCWIGGQFDSGDADPLPYVPLLNPLELGLIGMGWLIWGICRDRLPKVAQQTPIWVGAAFVFVSMATLRTVHHGHGERWNERILDSAFAHTSLTVVWSLLGVTAWIVGSRRLLRPVWLAGAGLMGVVLLKLILVDRQYMGNIPGIVSFLAVGLLLVAVGYLAPSPPSTAAEPSATADSVDPEVS